MFSPPTSQIKWKVDICSKISHSNYLELLFEKEEILKTRNLPFNLYQWKTFHSILKYNSIDILLGRVYFKGSKIRILL